MPDRMVDKITRPDHGGWFYLAVKNISV